MSGKPSKSQIPVVSRAKLPPDVGQALNQARQRIRSGQSLTGFRNKNLAEGAPLPRLADGHVYVEVDVGAAHPGDSRRRGSHRLVLAVNVKAKQIADVYYTTDHYDKGSFRRVVG